MYEGIHADDHAQAPTCATSAPTHTAVSTHLRDAAVAAQPPALVELALPVPAGWGGARESACLPKSKSKVRGVSRAGRRCPDPWCGSTGEALQPLLPTWSAITSSPYSQPCRPVRG